MPPQGSATVAVPNTSNVAVQNSPANLFQPNIIAYLNELNQSLNRNVSKKEVLTVPGIHANQKGVLPHDQPLSKDIIVDKFMNGFKYCVDCKHALYYVQMHEDGKVGQKLFEDSKVVCLTCLSQFIEMLYHNAIKPTVSFNNISFNTQVNILPQLLLPLPYLYFPNVAQPILFVLEECLFQRITGFSFVSSESKPEHKILNDKMVYGEYMHWKTGKLILIKEISRFLQITAFQALKWEIELLERLKNREYIIDYYGVSSSLPINFVWIALENMDISLEEICSFLLSENECLPVEVIARIILIIVKFFEDGCNGLFPTFDVKLETFLINWHGEMKLGNFNAVNLKVLSPQATINEVLKYTKDWRSNGIKSLGNLLQEILLLQNKKSLIQETKLIRKLEKFIKVCVNGNYDGMMEHSFYKECNEYNHMPTIHNIYMRYKNSLLFVYREIWNSFSRIPSIDLSQEGQIITIFDYLWLQTYTAFVENNDKQPNLYEKLRKPQDIPNFSTDDNGKIGEKLKIYLNHLTDKLTFSSNDTTTIMEICQKRSGIHLFVNLYKMSVGYDFKEKLDAEFKELDDTIELWVEDIVFNDSMDIPDYFNELSHEHWWWFRSSKS